MAKAIVENMEGERDKGNLELGRVGDEQLIPAKKEILEVETAPVIEEVSQEELEVEVPGEFNEEQRLDGSVGEAQSFIS